MSSLISGELGKDQPKAGIGSYQFNPDTGDFEIYGRDHVYNYKNVGVVNVKNFGAVGDGIADDTLAIQAAIDSCKPLHSFMADTIGVQHSKPSKVVLPAGKYKVTAPLKLYSWQTLEGEGETTQIVCDATLTNLIELHSVQASPNDGISHTFVRGVYLYCPNTTNAIKAIAANVLSSRFTELTLWCKNGIVLDTYTQTTDVDNIYVKRCDTIVKVVGNANTIGKINKEGDTVPSPSANAYVTVGSLSSEVSTGNNLTDLVIEGFGHSSKNALKLVNTEQTVITNFWNELSVTNGYSIIVQNSKDVTIGGNLFTDIPDKGKISIDPSSSVKIDVLNINHTFEGKLSDYVIVEPEGYLHIDTLRTRDRYNAYPYKDNVGGGGNIKVDNVLADELLVTPEKGIVAEHTVSLASNSNLLVNGNFDNGLYKWGMDDEPFSISLIPSEVGTGNMLRVVWSTDGDHQFFQTLPITAAHEYAFLTVTARLKVVGNGFAYLLINGVDVSGSDRVASDVDDGWYTMSATIKIDTNNGPIVGQRTGIVMKSLGGTVEFYIDNITCNFSKEGAIASNSFGSLSIDGVSVLSGTAIPTTGTFKAGDFILNRSVGSKVFGWQCVTAGSPGVWHPIVSVNHGVLANKAALDALNPRDGDTATVLDPLGITGCIKNCAVDLVRVSDAWVVSQQHERILFTNDASHNKGVFGKKVLDYRSVSTQAGFIVVKTAIPVGTEADLVVRLRAINFVLGMIDVSIFAYLQNVAVGYYSPSLRYRNLTVGQYNPNCYIGNSSDGKIVYIFGSNSDTFSSNFIAGVYATSGSRNFETVLGFLTGWELSLDSTPMTGTPASGTGVLGTITNIKQITAA